MFLVYVVLCLIVFGYQYRCNSLSGKTRLRMTYYVSSGTLNPTHSVTHYLLTHARAHKISSGPTGVRGANQGLLPIVSELYFMTYFWRLCFTTVTVMK